jgi:hypothetical protein
MRTHPEDDFMFDDADQGEGSVNELLTDLFAAIIGAAHSDDTGNKVSKDTTIYRVEMPTGRGPYNSGLEEQNEIYERICSHASHNKKKEPCWDCAKLASKNHEKMGITEHAFKKAHGHAAYACDSLEAVSNWFEQGAREYLRDQWQAKIVVYVIPKGEYMMTVGNGEVVFSKPACKRIKELDLVTYEELKG